MTNKTHISYQKIPLQVERVGKAVLDAAFRVHTTLGPGLLENVYEKALTYELTKQGISTKAQHHIPIIYDGQQLGSGLYCDLIVENCVIVELKAVEKMIPLFEAQLLTYLRISDIRLGFLINFNVMHMKNGIKRMVI